MPESTLPLEKQLPFPLVTLDFEASGLGPDSYPIEIGLAWWSHPDELIGSWSTLICPPLRWREAFKWHPASQKIHGITLEELETGVQPLEALEEANRRMTALRARMAFIDGGIHDNRWMLALADVAGIRPVFSLPDWDGLAGLLSPEGYQKMVHWLDRQKIPHRAEPDARLLLEAIRVGCFPDEQLPKD